MSDQTFILWLDDASAPGNALLGGKFASLAQSTAEGLAVPPGFGVTTAAYRHFMEATDLASEAARIRERAPHMALNEIKGETAKLVEGINSAPLPEALDAQIRASYADLEKRTGVSETPVAVRSSGESEDLDGASFAGQYDTYLWICGADAVIRHIRACWAGMFGDAVLSYRVDGETAVAAGDFGMCVGIQQMVEARAAGVMFTLNPLNGDRSKVVMEACWGLGEGVVKGDITPAQFTVDKVTLEILDRKTVEQTEMYCFDPAAGEVALVPMKGERCQTPCLNDEQVLELTRLAKQIERQRGAPQDIEWAVSEQGEVRVLQVRPETVWSRRETKSLVEEGQSPINRVLSRFAGVRVAAKAAQGEQQ
ncbi:PEP/pyruvate-binding domain-containing protein [Halomonas sp. MES3-P3E]|mgnify:CR=1 FL=1|uniref:PEP/pyruvate-binding domain-containing protein n=1 Tax=Halomonas sp. MES3-P3E TaxID=2058321 RepID=UPI000C34456E|nr:PEP/pyruvate-binding domain-containing protein [Halomonas sp. MES3-P3E]PKG54219.1 pyruvate, phosphate dikinase [Halomonas sp. MES3-P3E]